MEKLNPDQSLRVGQQLDSESGRFSLKMQSDGNLVLYRNSDGMPLWASDTQGKPADRVVMQLDGNLVVYTANGTPLWASNTVGKSGALAQLQNDGNLVLYVGKQPVWDTGTVQFDDELRPDQSLRVGQQLDSQSGRFSLKMQSDGNLVLYRNSDGMPLWASDTQGKPADRVVMQLDGNLVVYTANGTPLWASNTVGKSGALAQLQNDGNLVLYVGKQPVWDTGTVNEDLGAGYTMVVKRMSILVTNTSANTSTEIKTSSDKLTPTQQTDVVEKIKKQLKEYFDKNKDDLLKGKLKAVDATGAIYGIVAACVFSVFFGPEIAALLAPLATQQGRFYGAIVDDVFAVIKGESKESLIKFAAAMGTVFITAYTGHLPIIAFGGVDGWSIMKQLGNALGGAIEEVVQKIGKELDLVFTDIERSLSDAGDWAASELGIQRSRLRLN